MIVFRDPFDFLAHQKNHGSIPKTDSVLVAVDLGRDKSLDLFLAHNPHVREVHIVTNSKGAGGALEIERIKKHLDPFSIAVKGIDPAGLSKGRSRGPGFDIN